MRNRRIQKSRKQKKLKNVDPLHRKEAISTSFFKRKRQDLKEKKMIAAMKEQPIPKKALELFGSEASEVERKPKKKKNKNLLTLTTGDEKEDVSGHKRSLKCGNITIQQGIYETDEQFLRRLSKFAASAQAEAEIEEKFDVDLCGQNKEVDTNNDIIEEKRSSNRKKKRNERKKLKRKEAKMKNKVKSDDNDLNVRDSVKFGEEVEEPPDLSFVKFKKKSLTNKTCR